ncbi:MAG: peptidylprolyl isomerase [Thaumarchaeota archaeon]|nr:peptidylprolyl isomerase [Nitrososphaerota archaeon]
MSTSSSNTASSTDISSSVGAGPYAVLDTSQGKIVIQLFPQKAPKTVANFVSLAKSGLYNGTVWHRIIAGFVIQGGDPNSKGAVDSTRSTWGQGGSPNTIPYETTGIPNDVGYIAMARGPSLNSASSQFYINLTNNTSPRFQYAAFGKVISGMNVMDAIAALPVYTNSASFTYNQPINTQNALLISVTITETPPA